MHLSIIAPGWACAIGMLVLALSSPAFSQFVPQVPDLQSRIPEPLPPPPEPPIINGPYGQAPAPHVARTKRLRTFSDRAARCIDDGTDAGLRGGRLAAYVRRCANDR